jgi:hypothetical protein
MQGVHIDNTLHPGGDQRVHSRNEATFTGPRPLNMTEMGGRLYAGIARSSRAQAMSHSQSPVFISIF